jgi:hypothetical protein
MRHGNGSEADQSEILARAGSVPDSDRSGSGPAAAVAVRPLNRYRIWATPVLAAVLATLLAAYARKVGILSTLWLTGHKDALAALSSAISAAGIVIGGLMAYFRFFRGRTLATRADLTIEVELIPSPSGRLLHSITVSVKNVGTVTIWEPRPVIEVTRRHTDGTSSSFSIADWYELPDDNVGPPRLSALDSGETGAFFTSQFFEPEIWAVTYAAVVSCATGDSWTKLRTVENRVAEKKH